MTIVSKEILLANMSRYFDLVEQQGEELIVTNDGVAVLKIVPIRTRQTADEVFGDVRGKMTSSEDVTLPTADEWADR
jgi:antitoxin (DNA-binding transcriptional repressor) of toxin-antitoxin stability system